MAMKELPCSAGKSLTEKRKVAYNKEAVQRGTQTVGFPVSYTHLTLPTISRV